MRDLIRVFNWGNVVDLTSNQLVVWFSLGAIADGRLGGGGPRAQLARAGGHGEEAAETLPSPGQGGQPLQH